MKNLSFVFTGLQPWDISIGSNAIDIAKEMSTRHRVLYVNAPMDVTTLLKNEQKPENIRRKAVITGKADPLRKLTDTLWVLDVPVIALPVNGLPDGPLFDAVNRFNNRLIFNYISKVVTKHHLLPFAHFIDNDIYRSFYADHYLKSLLSIYYRRDNLLPFDYWKQHAPRLEPDLIKRCDLVVCNSVQLAEVAGAYNANTHDIGQGLDLDAYNPTLVGKTPELLANLPRPLVGYIGDITSVRLDPDLLYELANSRPGYTFAMIGPVDAVFKAHPLYRLPNVCFTGGIPKATVPEHMAAFDVCINPQKINEVTIGNYPRKIDEYLAMGKPVVATKTLAMERFKDYTYLCSSAAEYAIALDKALTETDAASAAIRRQFAQTHSWKNNVDHLLSLIESTLTNRFHEL
jgi:glycosyltransferase involved in cell wall biosynthesis